MQTWRRTDHFLVYLAAFSYFDHAGHTGVHFYPYQDGFLHQKALLVDDAVAAVGTANLDNRSCRLNFEINMKFAATSFAKVMEQMFNDDFVRCRNMMPGDCDNRSFWFKLAVRLLRLTSPLQ